MEMTSVNDPFEVHRVMVLALLPPYQPHLCKHSGQHKDNAAYILDVYLAILNIASRNNLITDFIESHRSDMPKGQ